MIKVNRSKVGPEATVRVALLKIFHLFKKAATGGVLYKNIFFKISQNLN